MRNIVQDDEELLRELASLAAGTEAMDLDLPTVPSGLLREDSGASHHVRTGLADSAAEAV